VKTIIPLALMASESIAHAAFRLEDIVKYDTLPYNFTYPSILILQVFSIGQFYV